MGFLAFPPRWLQILSLRSEVKRRGKCGIYDKRFSLNYLGPRVVRPFEGDNNELPELRTEQLWYDQHCVFSALMYLVWKAHLCFNLSASSTSPLENTRSRDVNNLSLLSNDQCSFIDCKGFFSLWSCRWNWSPWDHPLLLSFMTKMGM